MSFIKENILKTYEINYCIPFFGKIRLNAESKDEVITKFGDLSPQELLANFYELDAPHFSEEHDIVEVVKN